MHHALRRIDRPERDGILRQIRRVAQPGKQGHCLMTGNISEKLAKDKLLPLASFLDSNEPWKNEIQQVNVIDEQHIELIPMTGDHRIRIGNSDNIKEKMDKLLLFREEGLDKVGWNKYAYIDLSYNGQVVCTKKN